MRTAIATCLFSTAAPLTARPTQGECNVPLVFHIDKGDYNGVALDGLNVDRSGCHLTKRRSPGSLLSNCGDFTIKTKCDVNAAIRNVRFTSARDVASNGSNAQIAVIHQRRGGWVKSTRRRPSSAAYEQAVSTRKRSFA